MKNNVGGGYYCPGEVQKERHENPLEKVAEVKQERRKIADLRPAEYNPRKRLHPGDEEYERLKRSIETFGYVDPIIINADGTVIGGHQRLFVLQDLGYLEADVSVVSLSKADEKALNIALNKISGEWDEEKLAAIFAELDVEGYDLSLTGFEYDEYKSITEAIQESVMADIDDINSKSEVNIHKLKIDKTVVELTDDEYDDLMAELDQYLNINGVTFGFVRWLLHD